MKPYILMGAGSLGHKVAARLQAADIPILAFADNNPKYNLVPDQPFIDSQTGLPVLPPAKAAAMWPDGQWVMTIYGGATIQNLSKPLEQLRILGITPLSFSALVKRHPEAILPLGSLTFPSKLPPLPHFQWADAASKEEYESQWQWRTTLDESSLIDARHPRDEYFLEDVALTKEEVVVDAGAYDGDTYRSYIKRVGGAKCYYAFEPDPTNCARLTELTKNSPEVKVKPFALHEKHAVQMSFNGSLDSDSHLSDQGKNSAMVVALDKLELNPGPTYIKLDVEGSEIEVLRGARRTIQVHRPILAICAYHKPEHMWEIPRLILDIVPDYKLYYRRYAHLLDDQLVYGIPPERAPL